MEMHTQELNAVAKVLNGFLEASEPDRALSTALLSVTDLGEVVPDGGDAVSLVAWPTTEGGRSVLAVLGQRLIHATVGSDVSTGSVTTYRLADVRSVAATDLGPIEGFGSHLEWRVETWVVTLDDGHVIEVGGLQRPATLDRVAQFMRTLL